MGRPTDFVYKIILLGLLYCLVFIHILFLFFTSIFYWHLMTIILWIYLLIPYKNAPPPPLNYLQTRTLWASIFLLSLSSGVIGSVTSLSTLMFVCWLVGRSVVGLFVCPSVIILRKGRGKCHFQAPIVALAFEYLILVMKFNYYLCRWAVSCKVRWKGM